jgi:hypothetical protein
MALPEVMPCLTAFWDDFSRPAGVVGPRDFAPLIREVSDLSRDDIFHSPVRVYSFEIGRKVVFEVKLLEVKEIHCCDWLFGLTKIYPRDVVASGPRRYCSYLPQLGSGAYLERVARVEL